MRNIIYLVDGYISVYTLVHYYLLCCAANIFDVFQLKWSREN